MVQDPLAGGQSGFSQLDSDLRSAKQALDSLTRLKDTLEDCGRLDAELEQIIDEHARLLFKAVDDASHRMAEVPARTIGDVQTKLDVLVEAVTDQDDDLVSVLAISAANDLRAILGTISDDKGPLLGGAD